MKSNKYIFRRIPSLDFFRFSPCLRDSVVGFGFPLRPLRWATLAAILVSTLAAQNQDPLQRNSQQRVFTFKSETELVLVNVVARDKQGNLVQDLKREDFIILEDGKAQTVSSFDYEHIDSAPLPSIAGPAQQSVTGQPVPTKPILTVKDADEALSNKR